MGASTNPTLTFLLVPIRTLTSSTILRTLLSLVGLILSKNVSNQPEIKYMKTERSIIISHGPSERKIVR